jgi:hypothetical protein
MDIQPTNQQPISDDQELAKVLAGITAGADGATDLAADLEEEATAAAPDTNTTVASSDTANDTANDTAIPAAEPVVTPEPAFTTPAVPAAASGLEAIKSDALNELRPLVDKLNLSAEEKFDTYLLIIRSTDDVTLLSPAFEAARAITDETIKAQALLDVVKEIDYLSNPQKQAA